MDTSGVYQSKNGSIKNQKSVALIITTDKIPSPQYLSEYTEDELMAYFAYMEDRFKKK